MVPPPLMSISNLHVSFEHENSKRWVLQGVDLKVGHNEAVALVGESGSGKSLTALAAMRLLSKKAQVDSGEIWFDGEPLHSLSEREMQKVRGKKIGMIFQDPMSSLNPTMTIGNQISEGMKLHEHLSRRQARSRVLELMEQVGLADPAMRYNAYPFQLSGGMRQRVAIAIALACQPSMLIADEPTTALDATIQAQILDLIMDICGHKGMSLLLISHDLGVVARTCTHIAVMHQGKIVEEGNSEQIFYSPQHPHTRHLLNL